MKIFIGKIYEWVCDERFRPEKSLFQDFALENLLVGLGTLQIDKEEVSSPLFECFTPFMGRANVPHTAGVHNYKRLLFLVEFHVEVHVEIWQLCRMTTVTPYMGRSMSIYGHHVTYRDTFHLGVLFVMSKRARTTKSENSSRGRWTQAKYTLELWQVRRKTKTLPLFRFLYIPFLLTTVGPRLTGIRVPIIALGSGISRSDSQYIPISLSDL